MSNLPKVLYKLGFSGVQFLQVEKQTNLPYSCNAVQAYHLQSYCQCFKYFTTFLRVLLVEKLAANLCQKIKGFYLSFKVTLTKNLNGSHLASSDCTACFEIIDFHDNQEQGMPSFLLLRNDFQLHFLAVHETSYRVITSACLGMYHALLPELLESSKEIRLAQHDYYALISHFQGSPHHYCIDFAAHLKVQVIFNSQVAYKKAEDYHSDKKPWLKGN